MNEATRYRTSCVRIVRTREVRITVSVTWSGRSVPNETTEYTQNKGIRYSQCNPGRSVRGFSGGKGEDMGERRMEGCAGKCCVPGWRSTPDMSRTRQGCEGSLWKMLRTGLKINAGYVSYQVCRGVEVRVIQESPWRFSRKGRMWTSKRILGSKNKDVRSVSHPGLSIQTNTNHAITRYRSRDTIATNGRQPLGSC